MDERALTMDTHEVALAEINKMHLKAHMYLRKILFDTWTLNYAKISCFEELMSNMVKAINTWILKLCHTKPFNALIYLVSKTSFIVSIDMDTINGTTLQFYKI